MNNNLVSNLAFELESEKDKCERLERVLLRITIQNQELEAYITHLKDALSIAGSALGKEVSKWMREGNPKHEYLEDALYRVRRILNEETSEKALKTLAKLLERVELKEGEATQKAQKIEA